VVVDEVLKEEGNVTCLEIAALAQFVGDIGRDVLRPFFGGIEGDDADGVLVLALEHIEDHGFKVGIFDVGFPPGAAAAAKVVSDKLDVLIVLIRHD
jgi:hypothetical protein